MRDFTVTRAGDAPRNGVSVGINATRWRVSDVANLIGEFSARASVNAYQDGHGRMVVEVVGGTATPLVIKTNAHVVYRDGSLLDAADRQPDYGHETEAPATTANDYRITRADLEEQAERPLTDEEVERIHKALDNSTLGDVVGDVVLAVAGYSEEEG